MFFVTCFNRTNIFSYILCLLDVFIMDNDTSKTVFTTFQFIDAESIYNARRLPQSFSHVSFFYPSVDYLHRKVRRKNATTIINLYKDIHELANSSSNINEDLSTCCHFKNKLKKSFKKPLPCQVSKNKPNINFYFIYRLINL